MIILILLLILGSVVALTIYFKENKEMKAVHQHEIHFLEQRILEEKTKFKKVFKEKYVESEIYVKIDILKRQVELLTIISTQNNQL